MVMAPEEAGLGAAIERYVRELTAAGAIRSPRVERAFRAVHRHRLLETFYIREPGATAPPPFIMTPRPRTGSISSSSTPTTR